MQNQRAIPDPGQRPLLVGLLVVAGSFWASTARSAENALTNPKVTFTASSSNGAKIVGAGTDLRLEVRGPWLIFKVPLSAVSTQISARDRQMRDRYLEVDTHPSVELQIARAALNLPKGDGLVEGDASAKLSLHGKSRDTIVHYVLERQSGKLKVNGTFRVDLRAFGIDIPNYRGITVHPQVDVAVVFDTLDRAVVAEGQ